MLNNLMDGDHTEWEGSDEGDDHQAAGDVAGPVAFGQ